MRTRQTDDDLKIVEEACNRLSDRYRRESVCVRSPLLQQSKLAYAEEFERMALRIRWARAEQAADASWRAIALGPTRCTAAFAETEKPLTRTQRLTKTARLVLERRRSRRHHT